MHRSNSKKKSRPSKRKAKFLETVHNFSSRVGLSPIQISCAALLSVVVLGFILWATFTDRSLTEPLNSSKTKYAESAITLEEEIEKLWGETNYPNAFAIISEKRKKNEKIGELLLREDLLIKHRTELDQIRLRNLQTIVVQQFGNDIDGELDVAELREFSTSLLEHSDANLRQAAEAALCIISIRTFAAEPTKLNFEQAVNSMREYSSCFINDEVQSKKFFLVLALARRRNPENIFLTKSLKELSVHFSQSKISNIRQLGVRSETVSLFAKFNLQFLEEKIRFNDPAADSVLSDVIETLLHHPEIEIGVWRLILQICEAYVANGNIVKSNDALARIEGIVDGISESNERKKTLQGLLERQRIRSSSIGQAFDISGTVERDTEQIIQQDGTYTAIVFSDRSQKTLNALKSVAPNEFGSGRNCRIVLAFNESLDQGEFDGIRRQVSNEMTIASTQTSEKYTSTFPVDHYPYVILVNEKGVLVAANITLSQVKNRIAEFDANSVSEETQNADAAKN